ncbi:hypothetical protein A1F94_002390 [Pyrenophora tritici-repentis]|nr:hypothetical protein A1F94_002390 [Pyrenophora tritici-repentis]
MAFLFDFPQELFDRVLDEYVAITPLPEVFRARVVCRVFHRHIDHALLAETPASVYHYTDAHAQPSIPWQDGPRSFLDRYSYKLLLNHCKTNRGMNAHYIRLIHDLVDRLLLSADGQTNASNVAFREKYLKDLCRGISFAGDSAANYLLYKSMNKRKGRCMWPPSPDQDFRKYDHEASGDFLNGDILAAAAAVGHRDAVHTLLENGVGLWKTLTHLGCPIKLAAVNNQIGALFEIMEAAKTRLNKKGKSTWITLTPIKQAIESAVDVNAGASVCLLREFLLTLRERTQEAPEYSREGLDRMIALRAVPIGNARYVMPWLEESASKDTRAKHEENVKTVLVSACTAGQTRLVQNILDDTPGFESLYLELSMLAAQHGYRTLIDLFQGYGVVIEPQHLFRALDGRDEIRVESADLSKTYFLIVQHMINIGAAVDVLTLKRCEMLATELFRNRKIDDNAKHVSRTDKAMCIILVAHTAMKHVERSVLKSQFYTKNFLKVVLNGRIKVPYAPLPFTEMAREVIEWIETPEPE